MQIEKWRYPINSKWQLCSKFVFTIGYKLNDYFRRHNYCSLHYSSWKLGLKLLIIMFYSGYVNFIIDGQLTDLPLWSKIHWPMIWIQMIHFINWAYMIFSAEYLLIHCLRMTKFNSFLILIICFVSNSWKYDWK